MTDNPNPQTVPAIHWSHPYVLRVYKLLKDMTMYMTEQLADEFRITENFSVSLSGHAWSLLREMTMRTGMTVPTLIETALRGYDRAWKESE